jgi:hypothetical protein
MSTAWIEIVPLAAETAVLESAARLGESWVILESYTGIVFERWQGQTLGAEFAGRIFSPSGEVRWRREGDVLQGWFFHETLPGQSDEYEVKNRKYFAWGEWEGSACWEPRLTRPVEYPVHPDRGRLCFSVREYLAPRPAVWPPGADALEEALNRPRLAAYRLIGFHVEERGE